MTFDTNAWIGWILAVLCLIASPQLGAAPPAVIYLSPAGAQRGTSVEVIAAGSFERWPVQVWVSGNGVVAKAAKEKGRLAVTVTADAIPGVYWLRLHDELGASGLRPFVVGTLPEVAEKEPNDDPKKPQPVALPAVVNGRLDKAGDVDCFAVSLKKGQTLVAELEAHHTLRSPMDGVLQIVSPEGFVLDENHDFHGLDPLLGFTALKDGIYIVRVFAFPATPDSSIRFFGSDACIYRLTLTTGGYADHAWPLAAPRAAPGMVALVGWNIPEAARALPVPASGSVFHPAVANPVAVRLEPHPCRTAPVATGPLVPPVTLSGRLALPSQADTFSFSGAKGKPLVIQIESRSIGFPLTAVLRVLDAAGKPLARAEPPDLNRDCELTFTPPQDGPFRVEVCDLHGDGGPRFVYRLRVVPGEPDFDLTVAGDRFVLTPGQPLEVPVTVVRRNGFVKEIELSADGLPAGVTANSAAGKLRLTAERPGIAAPIRIVGREKGMPELVRVARATLAEFEQTTTDLWLTVGRAATAPKK